MTETSTIRPESRSFETLAIGDTITGSPFHPTRETIRDFCDASLDYNPLHWDDEYMKGSFGKTQFGGIIMHGMTNFGLLSRMLTDWLYPMGGVHRRLETRWKAPVKPGDTIVPTGTVTAKKETAKSRWAVIEVVIRNQHGATIAQGEATAEFPLAR
ncbi:phosphate acetyltransferase [Rhodoplanes elegans]|uniref:Phosphate acetyltransferase n=1 Tax=Rhodoplanes elegans TaxID=29408 RepID=A0A327KDA8_9BRAD|nr:MaoC family dehydratase [Rhodoplanes elegans]MBK5961497.1 phosphate acetyltransferase [Rhodoplanes elegans]RAI36750.1 phosphate acetyltransferase [Rhodoplanes elegans]